MMNKKRVPKICFILPNLNVGGAERVVMNIINSLDKGKVNIYLVVIDKIGQLKGLIPTHVHVVNLNVTRTRFSFSKMYSAINKIKPDLLFSSTNRTNILVLGIALFLRFKPKIVIREPNSPYAQFKLKQLPNYYLFLIKLLYRRATAIIAQTDSMKAEIQKYFKIPEEKISVIMNTVDYRYIDKMVQAGKKPYPVGSINIIASGRICKQKGFDFLIKSFRQVIDQNSNYKLFIIGNDDDKKYKKKLDELIDKSELNNFVFLQGFQENPYPYYKYADLFVLSSCWEGLPNVVLEALYLKTPVIVTNCIPFFKQIIKEGKNGFIVEFGDEIDLAKKIMKHGDLKIIRNITYQFDYTKKFSELISNKGMQGGTSA